MMSKNIKENRKEQKNNSNKCNSSICNRNNTSNNK